MGEKPGTKGEGYTIRGKGNQKHLYHHQGGETHLKKETPGEEGNVNPEGGLKKEGRALMRKRFSTKGGGIQERGDTPLKGEESKTPQMGKKYSKTKPEKN